MASTQSNTGAARGEGPARLACLQCRQKHLKCDGQQPVCNRCSSASMQCNYTASRRGYRGPSKRKHPNESILENFSMSSIESYNTNAPPSNARSSSDASLWTPESDYGQSYPEIAPARQANASLMESDPFLFGQLLQGYHPTQTFDVTVPQAMPSFEHSPGAFDEKLISLYYENFHAAHPILPPWAILRNNYPPRHLLAVLEFIGAHFSNTASRSALRAKLTTELNQTMDKSAALVQTRILTAVALHARNEQREAVAVLQTAIDVALEIGMNQESFATANGAQHAVIEESLRRTWWELYVVDGILAGLHQESGFRTFNVISGVRLPCEEDNFVTGQYIPESPSLEQFFNRFFETDNVIFSSYCYRIEAVRLLGRVLAVSSSPNNMQEEAESAGLALTSWTHHLPPRKQELLDCHGDIDEMLFQAHMIIRCATVYLNLPRSNLAAARPANADVECARRRSLSAPTSSSHVHAVNATKAAKELSSLASLPVMVHRHTPFFICSCVLSAVVQLSACAVNACKCLEPHRQQIIQSIGMLKTMGQVWPVAFYVLKQVRNVTNEVMKAGFKPPSPASLSEESVIDENRLLQEAMWQDPTGQMSFDLGQHTFSEG